jgi:HEAT repeat protein
MRAKVIIPVLALASLILLLAGLAHFGGSAPSQQPQEPGMAADSASAARAIPVQPVFHQVAVVMPAQHSALPEIDPAIMEEQRLEAGRQRVAELRDWATRREPNSLNTILSELSNPDAGIRRAALAAAMEFGDRSAIPALQEALESNSDPQDKVSLQRAIAFLQLPTLTEADPGLEAAMPPSIPSGN